jgi:hypothetical protein
MGHLLLGVATYSLGSQGVVCGESRTPLANNTHSIDPLKTPCKILS